MITEFSFLAEVFLSRITYYNVITKNIIVFEVSNQISHLFERQQQQQSNTELQIAYCTHRLISLMSLLLIIYPYEFKCLSVCGSKPLITSSRTL